jgi:hypothetical protein
VYYLAECSRLPVFRLGSVLCARKSALLQWISRQESRVREFVGAELHAIALRPAHPLHRLPGGSVMRMYPSPNGRANSVYETTQSAACYPADTQGRVFDSDVNRRTLVGLKGDLLG